MPCYKPLGGWVDTRTGGIIFVRPEKPTAEMTVACGQCLGCRLDKSRQWAARIVHESAGYDENCFITLTYRNWEDCTDEQLTKGWHLPADGSLVKSHFQKFMKRLRKSCSSRIRYYQVGEYGEDYSRPHYHACVFNFDFVDKQLFQEREGIYLFTSETLERLWPYGFSTVGELTFESAAYCARYVVKKVTGKKSDEFYLRCNEDGVAFWLEPEYSTMSRGGTGADGVQLGGIGTSWYHKYKADMFPSDEMPVPGKGILKKVPRFYEKILKLQDEAMYDRVKQGRQDFLKAHLDDFSPERLEDKYKVAKARFNMGRRSLEQ